MPSRNIFITFYPYIINPTYTKVKTNDKFYSFFKGNLYAYHFDRIEEILYFIPSYDEGSSQKYTDAAKTGKCVPCR